VGDSWCPAGRVILPFSYVPTQEDRLLSIASAGECPHSAPTPYDLRLQHCGRSTAGCTHENISAVPNDGLGSNFSLSVAILNFVPPTQATARLTTSAPWPPTHF
jgi:hypothetical protein